MNLRTFISQNNVFPEKLCRISLLLQGFFCSFLASPAPGQLTLYEIMQNLHSYGNNHVTEARNTDTSWASENHHNAWMTSGKYQGDIAGVQTKNGHYQAPRHDVYRNAVRDQRLRWTDGVIPYLFGPGFSKHEMDTIKKSMDTYHKRTCIRFVLRTFQNDFLYIVKDYGCYSLVGKVGGRQDISLGRGCIYHEIIVHELMHTLGFWHEQSRADRDQFISIQWHNIIPGLHGQFDKIDYIYADFLSETYDYKSVMHYDSKAFSKNGLDTIIAREPGMTKVIGKAMDLSEGDVRKINKLYKCADVDNRGDDSGLTIIKTTPPPPRIFPPPIPTVQPEGVVTTSTFQSIITATPSTTTEPPPPMPDCTDKFLDCPFFERYCNQASFLTIMKAYCPKTCNQCQSK